MTDLHVTFRDGDPHQIRFGCGYFGEPISEAYMDGSTAVVAYDNAGSTDFERELKRLPFVQAVGVK